MRWTERRGEDPAPPAPIIAMPLDDLRDFCFARSARCVIKMCGGASQLAGGQTAVTGLSRQRPEEGGGRGGGHGNRNLRPG